MSRRHFPFPSCETKLKLKLQKKTTKPQTHRPAATGSAEPTACRDGRLSAQKLFRFAANSLWGGRLPTWLPELFALKELDLSSKGRVSSGLLRGVQNRSRGRAGARRDAEPREEAQGPRGPTRTSRRAPHALLASISQWVRNPHLAAISAFLRD